MSTKFANEFIKSNHKPAICFVALNAYNLLSGRGDLSHTGGAEVQQVRIARWLVQRGYSVSFVTLDHGQPDGINADGIRIFKAYSKNAGIRKLRFIHPRWSGLWAAMARANTDIYYQRCAGIETGQVALWSRLHRRRFVFAAANDSDCTGSLYALQSRTEKMLYRVGLKLADAVTAQTSKQRRLLKEQMKKDSFLVLNCGSDLGNGSLNQQPLTDDFSSLRILWIGRISEQKRFEWLLDVAKQCQDITFDVVGAANADSDYSSALLQRAAKIPNVKMYGYVHYTGMAKYYKQCNILCCTSAYEGFPNTFLEAWSCGIPVVSTFDPDGVISTKGLGWIAQDVRGIVTCLRRIIKSPEIWLKASKAVRQYYRENHTPEKCLPAFERLLLTL